MKLVTNFAWCGPPPTVPIIIISKSCDVGILGRQNPSSSEAENQPVCVCVHACMHVCVYSMWIHCCVYQKGITVLPTYLKNNQSTFGSPVSDHQRHMSYSTFFDSGDSGGIETPLAAHVPSMIVDYVLAIKVLSQIHVHTWVMNCSANSKVPLERHEHALCSPSQRSMNVCLSEMKHWWQVEEGSSV